MIRETSFRTGFVPRDWMRPPAGAGDVTGDVFDVKVMVSSARE
jgi:hypothetical protein